MNEIRVLELIYGFQVGGKGGGIGRFVIELCRAIDRQKIDIYLGGLFNTGTALEEKWLSQLNAEGISAFCASNLGKNPYRGFWESIRYLWDWQSQNQFNIIHSHSEFSDIAALILHFHPSRPRILRSVHYGFQYEWRKRPLRRILLSNFLFLILFDAEIGVSQTITANLNHRSLAKILKRRALCIHNAIDLERFHSVVIDKNQKRKSLNINLDIPLVGTVGRLTEQKGYSILLDAASLVLKKNPKVNFLIVGDGELADTLQEQTRIQGIDQQVLFTGSRTDVEEILACLDLFVSSSLWEGFPTAIMESMASRVPIVATDIPGTRDLIKDGQNGWLVPPNDAGALARAILVALEDRKSHRNFTERARQDVRRYSIETIADEYETLYSALINAESK